MDTWLWSKTKDCTGYLKRCLEKSVSVGSFEECLYCEIIQDIDTPFYRKYYDQRRQLLAGMKLTPPFVFFERIKEFKKFAALKTLTDLTQQERRLIIELTAGLEEYFYEPAYELLETIYPDMAKYLGNDLITPGLLPDNVESYYKRYKWHKPTNTVSGEFINTVSEFAERKGYDIYSLPSRNELVSEMYNDRSAIYFIDCMGAEYMNLLFSKLRKLGDKFDITYRVGYCSLPSASEFNRDFLSNRRIAESTGLLDSFKHIMPDHITGILQELSFFDELEEKIEKAFGGDTERVILTSDHGSSRLAVLVRQTEFDNKVDPEGGEIFEYGRYCEGTELENKLPTAISYDEKLIFADYSRFTQKGSPTYEMHGGASVEEWLVPVITIDRRKADASSVGELMEYSIKVLTPSVKKNVRTGAVTVRFEITPAVRERVYVTANSRRIECRLEIENENNICSFDYKPDFKENSIHVSVHIGDPEPMFYVKIVKPIAQNKGFDI